MLAQYKAEQVLSTYEFKRYFNKYYYDKVRIELLRDKEDLYHDNTTVTICDGNGVYVKCRKADDIAIDLLAIDSRLKKLDERFKKYEKVFKVFTRNLDLRALQEIDAYFKLCDEDAPEPKIITKLRYELFGVVYKLNIYNTNDAPGIAEYRPKKRMGVKL